MKRKNRYNKTLLLKKHILRNGTKNLQMRKDDEGWCVTGVYKERVLQACGKTRHHALIEFEFMTARIDWEEIHGRD